MAGASVHVDNHWLTTLHRLCAVSASEIRPALNHAAALIDEASGPDKTDVFATLTEEQLRTLSAALEAALHNVDRAARALAEPGPPAK